MIPLKSRTNPNLRKTCLLSLILAGFLALVAGVVAGCNSSAMPTGSSSNITSAAVAVPVLITDAPADQLVAFTLTLNSIVLTDSAGKTTNILSTPTTIEVCHLDGIQEALVTASIPEDTYVSALITFSNPQITYINSSGQPVAAAPMLATTSYTATFASPITIGNTNSSLLFDLLASQSVTISGTTVTVSPVFSVKAVPSATVLPSAGKNGTGMQQVGTVVSASATSLVIEPGSGPDVTFTIDSATLFQGTNATATIASLTAGELVEVDFTTQTGGTLLATRVQLLPPNPAGQPLNLLTGPVTSLIAGTGFKMVLMQPAGPSVSPSSIGATYTIDTSSSTVFAISPQLVSLSGLPFTPSFSSANLTAGQTVAVTTSAISGTAATAADVYLAPQTVDGTVTAVTTSGSYDVYTLSLASGSAFTTLSGASTVLVYASSATTAMSSTAITVGSQIRFNGLIFNDSGTFRMVAAVCPDGNPHP
jgi:hypothetical protein